MIGFIGAGKVGTAFGKYLSNNGFKISGYYSRTLEGAKQAASITNSTTFEYLKELCIGSEIIFITTNDNNIEKVCNELCDEKLLQKGQIVVHMSGSLSSEILKGVNNFDCYKYSLHPLQAFAQIQTSVDQLSETVFTLEGDKEKIHVIEQILNKTNNKFFHMDKKYKSLYHGAACVLSNYVTTLVEEGLSYFEKIGIPKEEAYIAVKPLIYGALENIQKFGCQQALTGPIARGDYKTVQSHMEIINKEMPQSLQLYKILALKTLELAKKSKLKDLDAANKIKNILEKGEHYE